MALKDLLFGNINQEDHLRYNDVCLLYKPFPKRVYGFIFKYKCHNIIVINKNISEEKKQNAILHELAHLELSHIDKRKTLLEFNIEGLEDEADKYIEFLKNNI